MQLRYFLTGMLVALAVSGCDGPGEGTPDGAKVVSPPSSLPASVEVPTTTMVAGLELAAFRRKVDVPAFRLTARPVSRGLYEECVLSNGCPPLADKDCTQTLPFPADSEEGGTPEDLLRCATADEAASLCTWLGARLPRASEWLLAARGAAVKRFPWEERPECAAGRFDVSRQLSAGACAEAAGPSGLLDVLLSMGEHLLQDSESLFPACKKAACVVGGLLPHAIDVIEPYSSRQVAAAPTFRCLWEIEK